MSRRQLALAALVAVMPLCALAQDAPAPTIPQSATPEQIAAGEADFRRCSACHSIGEGAANRMGPQLNGIMGEPAATREEFGYSEALMTRRDEGLVWTPETLAAFLEDPRGFVPGTKMAFVGVKDAEDLANIIAYLGTFSPDWHPPAEPAKGPKNSAPPTN